jgi:hypothetical protein
MFSYTGDPSSSDKDAVRFWISDKAAPWKLADEEITYTLARFTNPMLAAAQCARSIAASYANKPTKRVGDLSISWGELATNYANLAAQLQSQGETFGLRPYAGGISRSDMLTVASNHDRVKPAFREGQFNNRAAPFGSSGNAEDGSGPDDGS